jgi:pentatricopeptide repeat protein
MAMAMVSTLRNQNKGYWCLGIALQDRINTGTYVKIDEAYANGSNMETGEQVRTLSKHGQLKEALQVLHGMDLRGVYPDNATVDSLLQGCLSRKALQEGKLVHAHIIQTGFRWHEIFLANKLVTMYAKCGSLPYARRALDQMGERNVVSWTVMIAAYSKNGMDKEALELFYQMQRSGIKPNQYTYASVLPAFANMKALQQGKEIHEEINRRGFESDVFVGNALIDMYAKCGCMEIACNVFDKMRCPDVVSFNTMISGYAQNGHIDEAFEIFQKMPQRDVFSWTAMIAAYAKHGMAKEALEMFYQMQRSGTKPNRYTYASVLPACASMEALQQGKEIHDETKRRGFQFDVFVGNALIDMYAKCGCMENACSLFDKMRCRDVVSFNTMISGYAQNGRIDEAFKIFQKMPQQDVVSCHTMISAYVQIGHIDEAFEIFQKMPQRDVFSWTTMIAAYVKHGMGKEALELFRQMQRSTIKPNQFTYASVLLACANMEALQQGKEIHEEINRRGFESDVFVGNALIDMYAKCGCMEIACNVFDKMRFPDVVSSNTMISGYAQNGHMDGAFKIFQKMPQRDEFSWTTMIAAYAKHGMGKEALELFYQMQRSGTEPNQYTYASVIPACANMEALQQGKEIHEEINRRGFQSDVFVGNALIDMYAKCGLMENAWNVFDKMRCRDVVSYNTMISAYAQHGHIDAAFKISQKMPERDIVSCHTMISGYAETGQIDETFKIFQQMPQRYVFSWTAMIAAYVKHGMGKEALEMFHQMQRSGIKPNQYTYASVLPVCANLEALQQGKGDL